MESAARQAPLQSGNPKLKLLQTPVRNPFRISRPQAKVLDEILGFARRAHRPSGLEHALKELYSGGLGFLGTAIAVPAALDAPLPPGCGGACFSAARTLTMDE